jgi:hypothetical protein
LSSADRYAQQIDEKRSLKNLTEKSLDYMSMPGGAVSGYFQADKLVLIQTNYGAEHGYISYTYYLRNDSLLLVKELKVFWKFSNEEDYERFEDYRKKHTDEKGVTDLSGWPMETDDDNSYYFHDTVIVDFKIRSFKKPKTVTEDEIAGKNKDLMQRLRIHCKELEYEQKEK